MANLQIVDKSLEIIPNPDNGTGAGDSDLPEAENESPNSNQKIKLLQSRLLDLQTRFVSLSFQNEKTNIDLAHEKRKVAQLERQLGFFKDKHTMVENLRQALVNVKCVESNKRKLVEIRDKSVQTWDGILCRACLDTEKIRNELKQEEYNNCLLIKREEIDTINGIVQTLKSHVNNAILHETHEG